MTSMLGEAFKTKFLKLAAVAVMYLGITSLNGALVALGSPLTLQNLASNFSISISPASEDNQFQTKNYTEAPTVQKADIFVSSNGYSPNYLRVKKGELVTLKLISQDAYSCAAAFRIPALGISKNLKANDIQEVTFTPQKSGKMIFSCSMGMYTGVIDVI